MDLITRNHAVINSITHTHTQKMAKQRYAEVSIRTNDLFIYVDLIAIDNVVAREEGKPSPSIVAMVF